MYIDELSVGQSAQAERVVTQADIVAFADVSGDRNPVHLDPDFAATTPFKGLIAHGMLSASFISALVATQLPGEGTIYLGQSLKFLAPVKPGDRVRTVATIKEINLAKRRVICHTACYVGDTQVIDGEANLMAPARPA